jgi:hypothetical protein
MSNRFKTTKAVLQGALCGNIWWPATKCTLPLTEDMRRRFERFSTSDISFRDALLSTLMEQGGDFQSASFTADTVLIIRRARILPNGHVESYSREIEVSRLKDCADLVDADTMSYDYEYAE